MVGSGWQTMTIEKRLYFNQKKSFSSLFVGVKQVKKPKSL